MSLLHSVSNRANLFFTLNKPSDILRILKLPFLVSLEVGKYVMMHYCGCEVNELNNWMSHAIRDPYYWRTAADGTKFVAGPYSPIWYLINEPARLGYWGWMFYLFLLDLGFSTFVFWRHGWKYIIPYMAGSIYFYNTDPIDFFVFQFALLGAYSLKWSLFVIIFKIPWFPPFSPWYAWTFILNNPYGIHEPGGLLRYGQMGLAFFLSIGLFFWYRKKKKIS